MCFAVVAELVVETIGLLHNALVVNGSMDDVIVQRACAVAGKLKSCFFRI